MCSDWSEAYAPSDSVGIYYLLRLTGWKTTRKFDSAGHPLSKRVNWFVSLLVTPYQNESIDLTLIVTPYQNESIDLTLILTPYQNESIDWTLKSTPYKNESNIWLCFQHLQKTTRIIDSKKISFWVNLKPTELIDSDFESIFCGRLKTWLKTVKTWVKTVKTFS